MRKLLAVASLLFWCGYYYYPYYYGYYCYPYYYGGCWY
jgi:hypothetical protein